jgi:Domain of unknown function (DUF5666)
MNYEDALDRALSLIHEPASLEAFLRTVPEWRDELNRALGVSSSVAGELRDITPNAGSRQRAQHRVMSVVEELGAARSTTPWPARVPRSFVGYRLAIAGLTAASILALAFVVGLPSQSGGGTQTAEAVIEGSVAEVGVDAVTISMNSSSRVVRLGSDTVLTDGFGNTVESSKLSAGQDVVLKGNDSGEDFVASEVELRDRLFGVVTALNGDGIQLNSSKGDFFVLVTPETQFEGVALVGSFVEIKLIRLSDGTLRALEIEVEDDEGGEDQHEGDKNRGGNSGPGNEDSAGSSSSGSSSPQEENSKIEDSSPSQKEDDHEDHVEHEDEHEGEHSAEED